MSNEITQINLLPKQLVDEVQGILSALKLSEIKKYFISGKKEYVDKATDDELTWYLKTCVVNNLNPWKRECWGIKYDNSPVQIIINYMVFIQRADLHPDYDGYKSGLILDNNILKGAWCEVYRKNRKHPVRVEVNFNEYDKGFSTWKSMPKHMIEKVAIKQAHAKAFPNNCANFPTAEEASSRMIEDESNVITADYEVKDEKELDKNPASLQLRKKMFATFNNHKVKSDMLKEYLKSTNQIEKSSTELTESNVIDLMDNAESISQSIKESIDNEPNEKPLTGKEESQQDLGV